MMPYNQRSAPRSPDLLHITPRRATLGLLQYEEFKGEILEPCCGDGAISEILIAQGHQVFSIDKYDHGYGQRMDFLEWKQPVNNIITNPPYFGELTVDIINHAVEIATRKVAMLLRLAFLEGIDRYINLFSVMPPARIYVFAHRLSMYPRDDDRCESGNGGTTAHAWFVWSSHHRLADVTKLIWIAP